MHVHVRLRLYVFLSAIIVLYLQCTSIKASSAWKVAENVSEKFCTQNFSILFHLVSPVFHILGPVVLYRLMQALVGCLWRSSSVWLVPENFECDFRAGRSKNVFTASTVIIKEFYDLIVCLIPSLHLNWFPAFVDYDTGFGKWLTVEWFGFNCCEHGNDPLKCWEFRNQIIYCQLLRGFSPFVWMFLYVFHVMLSYYRLVSLVKYCSRGIVIVIVIIIQACYLAYNMVTLKNVDYVLDFMLTDRG